MEVFSVFATMSLVDMLSGPLGRIRKAMSAVDMTTAGLGQKLGSLALAMAPVALAAGVMLGGFGACVATAAGFEDQMAKVGAVSRATGEEMKMLEKAARDLGASTQFTASQVGEAEQYLAMAGFSATENVAALPGVLNLAAATATDLGRAADISSDILGAFGMKAEEMTRVADALSLTCATANTNMELLGDTMKYVAPVARLAGMSLEETAAMAGLLGNVGIKGSQAGTTLKAMLNKLAAPTKEAQAVFQRLGVTVKDAAGNLRSPVAILGEMAEGLKKMGTAEQIAAMKAVVGEEAIAGFAELIQKQGVGAIADYAKALEAGGGTAAQMAERMNSTLAGSMRNMGSAWESVQITIGQLFLPAAQSAVSVLTWILRLFDKIAKSPLGAFLIRAAGLLGTAVVAVTAFSAACWGVTKVLPLVSKALTPIYAQLMTLGWPVWLVIGAITALYVAYRTNFGGIADTLDRWGKKISLVVRGVVAIFDRLKGSTFEIRGELAKEIKAAGLENLVVTIGKIVYRIKAFFSGIWDGLNFDHALEILAPVAQRLGAAFSALGDAIGSVFGFEVTSAASEAKKLGEILGNALSWGLEAVATVISVTARGLENLVALFRWICAIFTGDWSTATQQANVIWDNFCASLMEFADLFRIGDWLRAAWADATAWFDNLNLYESGAKLLETFKQGLLSKVAELKETFSNALSNLRNLLPFSDAKEGPLSTLTLSGSRLMSTLGEGLQSGFPGLYNTLTGKLGTIKDSLGDWWNGITGDDAAPEIKADAAAQMPEPQAPTTEQIAAAKAKEAAQTEQAGAQSWTLHIANITLPNVKDANSFYDELRTAATSMGA